MLARYGLKIVKLARVPKKSKTLMRRISVSTEKNASINKSSVYASDVLIFEAQKMCTGKGRKEEEKDKTEERLEKIIREREFTGRPLCHPLGG